jgi:hypothetical protein
MKHDGFSMGPRGIPGGSASAVPFIDRVRSADMGPNTAALSPIVVHKCDCGKLRSWLPRRSQARVKSRQRSIIENSRMADFPRPEISKDQNRSVGAPAWRTNHFAMTTPRHWNHGVKPRSNSFQSNRWKLSGRELEYDADAM